MKHLIITLIFAVVAGMASVTAQNYYVSSLAADGSQYFKYELQGDSLTFGSTAAQQSVPVSYNKTCTVSSSEDWCSAAIEKNLLKISVQNNSGAMRKAVLSIEGKDVRNCKISVVQLGAGSPIVFSPAVIEIGNEASGFVVNVLTASTVKKVAPAAGSEWITAAYAAADLEGSNTLALSFKAAAMTDASERTGYITVETADGQSAQVEVKQSFNNALSFAVISDVHVGNSIGEGSSVKVPLALKNISSYKPLDAILVAGDLTDGGNSSQYTQFVSIWGNDANFTYPIDKMIFMMGNHDNYDGEGRSNYMNGLKAFNKGSLYPLDQYIVIKGYPFITISMRGSANNDIGNPTNGTNAYPKAVCDTLAKWMERAAKECPGKPIFVFTHVPPRYTCYSSWPKIGGDGGSWDSWGMNVLNPILNNYPQAVVFAGHSHYPLGDPRSIHQGTHPDTPHLNYYTVVNTASTNYSEINGTVVDEGIHPAMYDHVIEGLILTEMPNGNIEIRRYDTYRNEEIGADQRWVLKAPFDGSMFEYADVRDADDNPNGVALRDGLPAPYFADGTQLATEVEPYKAIVKIPQAKDETCVFRYRIRTLKNGLQIKDNYVFSQFYLNSEMPDTLDYALTGLRPETEYTVEVTAYDSYMNMSSVLSTTFTTPIDDNPANQVPARSGRWTFDDASDLMKSTEGNKAGLQPGTFVSNTLKYYSTASEAGISAVEGPTAENKAILVPAKALFKLNHNAGAAVKDFTIQLDVNVPYVSDYNALFQSSVSNNDDADIFISSSGQLGVAAMGYGGKVKANTWYRILLVNRNGHMYVYQDGVVVADGSSARWNMTSSGALLFADEDGETSDINVAEVAYWDKSLTENQIANLGDIEVDSYLNVDKNEITLYDEPGFSINITGNVAPSFEFPEWITADDITPVIGAKGYTFKVAEMPTIGKRVGQVVVSGNGLEDQIVKITQINLGKEVPEAIGCWTFDDTSNLMKGTGTAILEAAKEVSNGVETFANPADANITVVAGPSAENGAVMVPVGSCFKLNHKQGVVHNNYTMMWDVKPTVLSGYCSLLQNKERNDGDASFFIKNNSVGLANAGLGYNGTLKPNTWHRIIFVVNNGIGTAYIDGVQVGQSTSASAHWPLRSNYALIFADNDGEEKNINVAEFRYWNIPLTPTHVEKLGAIAQ